MPYTICVLVIWHLPLVAPKEIVPVPVDVTRNSDIDVCVTRGGTFTTVLADRCNSCDTITMFADDGIAYHYPSVNDRAAVEATCTLPEKTIYLK